MDALIRLIEEEYGLTVIRYQVERNTNKSLVLILKTSKGKYVGKSLFNPPERQDFILDAEAHLIRKGLLVPKTKQTKDHKRYIIWRGFPFLLQEWAPGPMLALNSPHRIKRTGATLGRIHAASIGFSSPTGEEYNGALIWEEEYDSDFAHIQLWRKQHARSTDPKHVIISQHLPFFLIAGKIAIDSLRNSSYFSRWKKMPCNRHFLCHGDFNNGNLLSEKQKITVIDWEDVRYDFPSKDISRILSLMMRKNKRWKPSSFTHLMSGYLQENPLSRRQRHLLYVDLAFPHIAERFLRQQQYVDMTEREIATFLKQEIKKIAYMLEQMKALE